MHRKLFIIFSLVCIWTAAFSQSFPDSLTSDHQLVGGTNIYMVPPDSFALSEAFKGFQNPADPTSMIMIMEIPGPFSEITKGFNEEMLATRGMELSSKEDVQIAGVEGVLIALDQPANGMLFSKYILIFGDESATTMINGVFLKEAPETGDDIRNSLLSTYVDTGMDVDPRAALSYTLDETAGGLQFYSVMGNAMLFNRDRKIPTESNDQATLVVDRSFADMQITDKEEFCIRRTTQYPENYEISEDKGINEVTIDGLSGLELYAENIDDEVSAMYQLILFEEDGGYFLFMGTYLKAEPEALADIQAVIRTFERK